VSKNSVPPPAAVQLRVLSSQRCVRPIFVFGRSPDCLVCRFFSESVPIIKSTVLCLCRLSARRHDHGSFFFFGAGFHFLARPTLESCLCLFVVLRRKSRWVWGVRPRVSVNRTFFFPPFFIFRYRFARA